MARMNLKAATTIFSSTTIGLLTVSVFYHCYFYLPFLKPWENATRITPNHWTPIYHWDFWSEKCLQSVYRVWVVLFVTRKLCLLQDFQSSSSIYATAVIYMRSLRCHSIPHKKKKRLNYYTRNMVVFKSNLTGFQDKYISNK